MKTESETIVLHAVTRGAVKDTARTLQGQGWGWHVAGCLVVPWARAAHCVLRHAFFIFATAVSLADTRDRQGLVICPGGCSRRKKGFCA